MAIQEFDLGPALSIIEKAFDQFGEESRKTKEDCVLNVLVVGKSGVGKSSLINAVFGENVAKTGQGKPVTQKVEVFSDQGLTIYDTRGIESENFLETISEVEKLLEKKITCEVNEQIHIAWLCIGETNRRVEGEERILETLRKHKIPTIVVITKAWQDKDINGEKFSDKVVKILGLQTEKCVRTRAVEVEDDEGNTKAKYGIDELVSATYLMLPDAKKLAFARKQTYNKTMRREALKQEALEKVNYYSTAAGAVAATPIPCSDFALLLPTQIVMILHISNVYEMEINKDNAIKLITALGAVAGTGYVVKLGVGAALKFIPVVGSLAGGAINATVAGTTTKLMGNAYVEFLDEKFIDNVLSADFVLKNLPLFVENKKS